jgi:CPA2 family monovalent cation:H+ antiporter-2
VLVLRYPVRTAIAVAIALAQIGEFSFMVAALGRQLGALPAEATQSLVAVSIISITLNPLLYKVVDPLARRFAKPLSPESDDPERSASGDHVIVVGYGPVGQQVVELLHEYHLVPTVVDLNLDTVRKLRELGVHAIYGDASHREILLTAGIQSARGLVFASNAFSFDTVKAAVELNPGITVLARTTYLRDAPALQTVGASVIVSEAEVALAMTEQLMDRLGATAEQLDRARARVRSKVDALLQQTAGEAAS